MANSKLPGPTESINVNDLENYGCEHLVGLSKHDRFCVACGFRKSDAILQKRLRCPKCNFNMPASNSVPSFWSTCLQCTNNVDCTFRYCRTCGCTNTTFEPGRPEREQRLAKAEIKKILTIENIEKKKRKKEEKQKRAEEEEAKKLRADDDGDAICSEGLSSFEDAEHMNTTNESDGMGMDGDVGTETSKDAVVVKL